MGSYTFQWPYNAHEVFVTGTFDDWGKTIKLDRIGDDVFEKEVHFPATSEKVHYKFVVDGIWTTDNRVPEEDDGDNNVNNVLYPNQIQKEPPAALENETEGMSATISSVAPDSTTAALAAGVPKESDQSATQNGIYTSSAAPGSTTAELGKDVPLEQRANVPAEYSVNPIPASSGIGNPIHLKPGEKVPDPSTFNPNTIQSTVRTDKGGYAQEADTAIPGGAGDAGGAFAVPPVSRNMIPESSLPMGSDAPQGVADPGVTIQSAAPTSTTAGLAAAVPLESQKQTNNSTFAADVPEVVRHSISKAHRDPEATSNKEVVEEKKEVEHELQQKVHLDNSVGAPAPTATVATATQTSPSAMGEEPGSAQLSPRTTTPTGTAGAGATKTQDTTTPATNTGAASQVPEAASKGTKEEKKKKRSSIFARIKEKFK
ncbi:hypothetical protein P175DRAFT_0435432 [Aspergillus ochraceoroseus IBT 24754]|uniref:AMP-activated protein kinase glycogen-binding domain-containing protein n=3 Tax=Aspergillus subgen. Nidulantes TaxID=2720870 RepID=A0A0F8X529_9EURO|nr:uncharacterized protein P175DRAFT_0435432 [Aspergillus ochraceoroseus IBT 24754]KKK14478.1 hypothetical protein AOCH_006720 [Aspergillus ochraceoroseus]KKK24740.1 hypothetical protein ARAM_006935 [Aspergillus rambellii]PTU21634.1 hypothetical protein P175DRAFT_0435432 [Aspergillus ochraceoroseus IBT 24754]